jgi:hypothetical protein
MLPADAPAAECVKPLFGLLCSNHHHRPGAARSLSTGIQATAQAAGTLTYGSSSLVAALRACNMLLCAAESFLLVAEHCSVLRQ